MSEVTSFQEPPNVNGNLTERRAVTVKVRRVEKQPYVGSTQSRRCKPETVMQISQGLTENQKKKRKTISAKQTFQQT